MDETGHPTSCHSAGQRCTHSREVTAPGLPHCLITGLSIFSVHGLLSMENGVLWTMRLSLTITVGMHNSVHVIFSIPKTEICEYHDRLPGFWTVHNRTTLYVTWDRGSFWI